MLNTMPDGKISQDYANTIVRNPLLGSNSDNVLYNIKDFFARPLICPGGAITWGPLATPGTALMTMNVPGDMLTTYPLLADKLKGFYGFKATTVIRIQANAQKFQTGILLGTVLLNSGYLDGFRIDISRTNLITRSQLPSVRFNVSELDEVEIRVPFVAPELFRNVGVPVNWAEVAVVVYAQSTGGPIPLTCWCHFEDCEFLYPVAQSAITSTGKRRRGRAYDISDKEDPGGLISQPLGTFAKGFSQLASNIPMLSSFSAPTAWFLDAVSKGASAFGLSKVIETTTRSSFVRRTFGHMANADVNDTSDSLGLTVANKIAHMPGFAGTDIDEMSFAYIAGVPSYWNTFIYDSTSPSGTQIFSAMVGPMVNNTTNLITPSVGTAVNATYFAPMGYLASQFNLWRGTMNFRIFAAKNDFHTGRLLFTFTPSMAGSINPSYNNNGYTYRWIWDIRDSHSFEISIPYVASKPYCLCAVNSAGSIGYLTCYVLNPLTAPATVSSTIQLIVEQSAGADFELAELGAGVLDSYAPIWAFSGETNPNHIHRHRARRYVNAVEENRVIQQSKKRQKVAISKRRLDKYAIYAEGPEVNTTSDTLHIPGDTTDGNIPPNSSGAHLNALYCIGEKINSLRQVLKRASLVFQVLNSSTTDDQVYINPFLPLVSTTYSSGAQHLLAPNISSDYYSTFANLFALQRGGMIIKSACNVGVQGSITHTLVSTANNRNGMYTDTSGTRFDGYDNANAQVYSNNASQATNDTLIPWFSMVTAEPIFHLDDPTIGFVDFRPYMNYKVVRISANVNTSSTFTLNIYRHCADDFSFGCFLGVLPMYSSVKSYR